MSDSKSTATSSGISLDVILTIVFVILKLTKVIDWSWWWVFSPLWIGAALVILIIIFVIVIAAIVNS